jgi:Uma2 family endonuclease
MATAHDPEIADELVNGIPRPTGPMTEDEFMAWSDEDVKAEWVDGAVILMSPSSYRHVDLVGWFTTILGMYASAHDLGKVIGPEFMVRLGARRRIRVPDVLFIAKDRLDLIRPNHLEGAPDLAIEVVSPDSQSRDRREKYADYEASGVREYWIVDPISEDLEVHILDAERRFRPRPIIDGRLESTVLPGFWVQPEWLWQSPLPNEWTTLKAYGLPG